MTELSPPSRRALFKAGLTGAGALAAGLLLPGVAGAAPALVRRDRPILTHGVQSGDVTAGSGIVWSRADRPSRLIVEIARDESFRHTRRVAGPVVSPDTGGTGKVRVAGLPPGTEIHYRVTAEALDGRTCSEPLTGRFATAPVGRRDTRILWSGDVVGQNWGIDTSRGGMTIFGAMADRRPDLFLHSGDTVYADGPLTETVTLPGGRTWRNVMTPEKAKVAETLDEYRGQHAYNRLDEHFRRFAAEVPVYAQWDDHEVVNNWYPGEILNDRPEYTEKRVDVLAPRAFQAFHEWHPIDARQAVDGRVYRNFRYGSRAEIFVLDMRTYRDANTSDQTKPGHILGDKQARWLVGALDRSTATWKIIQADMPIGLVVPDSPSGIEAVANGLPGAPGGRETELHWVLREIARRRVRNVVWLTADVHYTAAHHYSPDRAAVGDFEPFWEFVSGPLNAGAFGPNKLDPTFGPEAVFVHAPPAANTSPADGYQHFGELNIDGASGVLTVDLRDATGTSLWSKTLQPQRH
ncbi:alkaline phosphatase D family protein [Amycolatopsis sp. NPDC059021]|uniref:alkaline phosphatase D family protein n=1 Tax=Amycolatopsis sp. NPDC059021 TaxID=3346704 RepID=UPI00366EA586